MINNRQSGRRRGRGGGPRTPNNSPSPGNRQDNRQRGNAAQLLEKYKAMARDAQMQGDRVQTEYYLQFADHYHRVLSESRSRFEEQRRQRDDYMDEDEDQDDLVSADGEDRYEDEREERPDREERHGRGDRQERGDGSERGGRPDRGERQERGERPERFDRDLRTGESREARDGRDGRLRRRGRRDRFEAQDGGGEEAAEERIAMESLPPAIAVISDNSADAEDGHKPARRRARRPRDEGEAEIAPAA